MSNIIPADYQDLLTAPLVVTLVTLMPDGTPQASPVWFAYDGTHILINTAKDRQKDRNMRQHPSVVVLAIDPDNPYRYLEVRGVVDEITEDGAADHIDALSYRYVNADYWSGRPGARETMIRVIFKIKPTHATVNHT